MLHHPQCDRKSTKTLVTMILGAYSTKIQEENFESLLMQAEYLKCWETQLYIRGDTIVYALKQFRYSIYGTHFEIHIDHQAL